eukprot:CAMPEP_0195106036 /NCGR_PEP_ID=MMETSP0448-20130528/78990_1 /TAXON_ID=66468 /ORGANISM="Heterocapsa triquestra, Strain CCMP 448" /LENGTH=36 /DNA_ID= /DNA_START= /DNA_END= /DNA_ORIENTATION=
MKSSRARLETQAAFEAVDRATCPFAEIMLYGIPWNG